LYKEKQEKRRIYNTDLDSGEVIRAIMAMAEPGAQNDLDQAAQLLADRQQVIWFGCGTSRIVAEFGAITYSSLVKLSLAISDPLNHPVVRYNSETAQDTCVIVCSVSGENRMVINYMSQLITNNVPIIAITNNSDSTIAKMAKLNLSYFATEQKVEGANVTTQTPAIFLIEKLIRRVSSLVHQETAVEPDNIR
jgi:DNA-binding MurR/RpiR family transcriptional regulator